MNCIFHIGSKEAELVCIELENESDKIKQIEQIITQKMKREIIIDNVTEKSIVKRASMIAVSYTHLTLPTILLV